MHYVYVFLCYNKLMKNFFLKNIKKLKIIIPAAALLIAGIFFPIIATHNSNDLKTIKSEKELLKFAEQNSANRYNNIKIDSFGKFISLITFAPLMIPELAYHSSDVAKSNDDSLYRTNTPIKPLDTLDENSADESSNFFDSSVSKDYSTTNIQVANVDEADIIKTDGNYIYSLSDSNVIITEATTNPTIVATIPSEDDSIPEDLIIYNENLVIIAADSGNDYNTSVRIYDITDKSNPVPLKHFSIPQDYYTSRRIDNQLYIISSGKLEVANNTVNHNYIEDHQEKTIALENIKYLKDVEPTNETILASLDLENIKSDIKTSAFLIDVSNAYISESAFYLLDEKYENKDKTNPYSPLAVFNWGGIIGLINNLNSSSTSNRSYSTEIYKFNILDNGTIQYATRSNIEGRTINQYSMDEYNEKFRIALYQPSIGSSVAIFDDNLQLLGRSTPVESSEQMYASRFIENRAYLVTYRNTDPLFVIDLSDVTNPQVLGELHIPGYSTYLHPYDDNHLIGFGIQTQETIRRNSSGKVSSVSTTEEGIKMALFDVTDVTHPIQISETVIGDANTDSPILTNPKALLFSKEKELVAIPVNNYEYSLEDVDLDNITSSTKRISEGYFVYTINLTDGFKLRGSITHDPKTISLYSPRVQTELLRGIYIDNNLFTVSENQIKVSNLQTTELTNTLNIKEK